MMWRMVIDSSWVPKIREERLARKFVLRGSDQPSKL